MHYVFTGQWSRRQEPYGANYAPPVGESVDTIDEWMLAGGAALLANVPMSPNRFEDLAAYAADSASASIVDFGCGRGAFAHRMAELNSAASICGLDTSADAIEYARRSAIEADLGNLRYEVADAAQWIGPMHTAICLGSSHAFGDTPAMFARLHALGAEFAIIGDGFWQSEPDEWCLENLGDMPRRVTGLCDLAAAAGWETAEVDVSTIEEWDAFERQWGDGVRSVGTPGAVAFAQQRADEYSRYRGVLGFGWLKLSRLDKAGDG